MSDVLEETEEAVEDTDQTDVSTEESVEAEAETPVEETAEEPVAEVAEEPTEEVAETSPVEKVEEEPEEERHELSRPQVIDLKALLHPISGEKPSGESVRYTGIYDEIKEARRRDLDLAQGEWQTDLKTADYHKVIEIAVPVLEKETKDIQIAAWLSESLVREYGFAGLRDSLKLATGLQNKFWETLYPEIDEGDMEGRANAMAWMDEEAGLSIRRAPITSPGGYSLLEYDESKKFVVPADYESMVAEERDKYAEIQSQIDGGNVVTQDKWENDAAGSKRAFYEELNVAIEECLDEYKKLNLVIEEKYDRNQAPALPAIRKALEGIKLQTDKLLEQKREEEPDELDEETVVNEDGTVTTTSGVGAATGAINNRNDALKRLGDVADFFRKTEPHSPVSYLVNRAVKWGKMPLDGWLQDVIKDENVLYQLREVLGFNTGNEDGETATATEEYS